MAAPLALKAALKRGAVITIANWPVVLVDFGIEALYKAALAVPIIGGAFVVAVVLGHDLQGVLSEGTRAAADGIVSSLTTAPFAFAGFLAAVGLVACGGAIVMFVIKAGTLSILVTADRSAGEFHRDRMQIGWIRRAAAYRLETLLANTRKYAGRSALLGAWLAIVYGFVLGVYLAVMAAGLASAAESVWGSAWPLLVLIATSAVAISIALINLAYDLLRIIMVTDDCRLSAALSRLRGFLLVDARQVIGIFAVTIAVLALAAAVSLLAASMLALVSWVPVVGIIVVPLQALAWVIRGARVRVRRLDRALRLPDAVSPLRRTAQHAVPRAAQPTGASRMIQYHGFLSRTAATMRAVRDPADGDRAGAGQGHDFVRARISGRSRAALERVSGNRGRVAHGTRRLGSAIRSRHVATDRFGRPSRS